MNNIVYQITSEFYQKVVNFFSEQDNLSLEAAEQELSKYSNSWLCSMLKAYYEQADAAILKDKSGRKAEGLVVERRQDPRVILSCFGEIDYARTYYWNRKEERYCYPVDEIAGIEKNQRLSTTVSLKLASLARQVSYSESSRIVTQGAVSRQSVMSKLRASHPVESVVTEKRTVAALHIDADEAHVTLSDGKKSIVPLISVYEGIESHGKRRRCKNIFHISEYGKSNEELWEQALSAIEQRYELTEATVIYIHGDGAAWIAQGQEWFPHSKFVLDKYHRNKAIKAMTAGITGPLRKRCERELKQALAAGDQQQFRIIQDSMAGLAPKHSANSEKAGRYLLNQLEAISICSTDPEANNGGCTEPHVSHLLASRLSSRPMKWSATTLKALAPMLASGERLEPNRPMPELSLVQIQAIKQTKQKYTDWAHYGLPHPDSIGKMYVNDTGKVNPAFRALRSFAS